MEIQQSYFSDYIKLLFPTLGGVSIGYLMVTLFPNTLFYFEEIRSTSTTSVLGTIYALITAFILVNSWNQYNTTNESISKENEALVAIWNNTDFLEDPVISKQMKKAIQGYLSTIRNREIEIHLSADYVKFASPQLAAILKVIDRIQFDDPRDPIAFESLVKSYDLLSNSRTARITNIDNSIPGILRLFYIIVSLIFWFSYLFQGLENTLLYYAILGIVSVFTSLSYIIIMDLDNPLNGFIKVEISKYADTAIYIEEFGHDTFSVSDKQVIAEWKTM